jgi:hypothetical protein
MKKITKLFSLVTVVLAFSANAEVKLLDNSKILGKWRVNFESIGLDKEKRPLNVRWDFGDNGILHAAAEDTLGRTKEMEISVKYSIENGIIKKQVSPGREKYEECVVLDLDNAAMTLKCKGIYFFMTR